MKSQRAIHSGLLILLFAAMAHTAAAAEPRASVSLADSDLHLLVDDHEIESVENLARIVNRPKKHPEPVLISDKPWEGGRVQAWGSVIQEPDGRLRMWYFSINVNRGSRSAEDVDRGGYGYAESRDGIHWTKPNLGVVEFRGSKDNNLFYTFAPDGKNLMEEELGRRGLGLPALDEHGKQIGIVSNADGISVVRDDADPDPNRRYKLIANMQDHRMWAKDYPTTYPDVTPEQLQQARAMFGQYLDTSPDGIHWTRRPRRLMKASGGDYMMVTRDERNRRWWLNERASGKTGRNAALRTSPDFVQWSELTSIFDNDAESDYGRAFQWHGGMTPFNYGNQNLGLLEKWTNHGMGANCELISGRDGQPWRRVSPGTAWLDVGPEGSFDRLLAYPTHNAPIRVGNKLHIYYTGGAAGDNRQQAIPMVIGLATISLDRFAGMGQWRASKPGKLVTRPLRVKQPKLLVNVEPFDDGQVRVAVQQADGTAIAGYGFDDSQVALDRHKIYAAVSWKHKPDLSELLARDVRLQFEIVRGALYSYRFVADERELE